ncbi:MAG TPA: ATP-binding protein, partial [Thermoanaerobaculia bacterium]|nr:ATP-binding protein [Thermoanaerobaculia bacterium]
VIDLGENVSKLGELRQKILSATPLVLVKGALGAGKTALVSTTLNELFKRQRDRVIWIDLSAIERSEEALVETILLRLGRAGDLALPLRQRYDAIRETLQSKPTVLVLDSAHVWEQPLPPDLLRLHGWKTLLLIAVRDKPPGSLPAAAQIHDVDRLLLPDFKALIESIGKRESPTMLTLSMYESSQGSALHAAWAGQLLARNPAEAEELNKYIALQVGPFLMRARSALTKFGNRRRPGRPAVVPTKERRVSDTLSFRMIHEWLSEKLNPNALALLTLLCAMPGGFRLQDLKQIFPEIPMHPTLDKLDTRNLLHIIHTDGLAENAVRTCHPFAREVWNSIHPDLPEDLWQKLVKWSEWVLRQYGRSRDSKVSPIVSNQWANLARVLDVLSRRESEADRRQFLDLWKLADGFLWAGGRWRERLMFAQRAEMIARGLGDVETEIIALADGQAKTIWHREADRENAERLLLRAIALADAHDLLSLRARIEVYCSRMLLHVGEAREALEVANNAVVFADAAGDAQWRVIARINLGNAHRENDSPAEVAFQQYDEAEDILNRAETEREEETRAVLQRNRGRVFLRDDRIAEAIDKLEDAMDRFREQKLLVQEARTAVHYAEALSAAGEPWTAEQFLRWGRQHLDPLGSVVMNNRMAAAQQAINDAKRRGQSVPAARA